MISEEQPQAGTISSPALLGLCILGAPPGICSRKAYVGGSGPMNSYTIACLQWTIA